MAAADLSWSPPAFAQQIHRRLRAITASDDPHRAAKERQNRMVLRLLPRLRQQLEMAPDPLDMAVRLALAGNAIDMGVTTRLDETDLKLAITQALNEPLHGDVDDFYNALDTATDILYLADNAGEIALDRLFIEQLAERMAPGAVTVAVRGAPVLNDATRADAQAVGLDTIVEVIDNGSDAPGTILSDCSEDFQVRFAKAHLVLAKGQGNFESLSAEEGNIFFLFKVKCKVIADQVGAPVGSHVVSRPVHALSALDGAEGSQREVDPQSRPVTTGEVVR